MARQDRVGKHATTIGTDRLGNMVVTYHNTDIVAWNDNWIHLDAGIWSAKPYSATTKTRMNQTASQFNLDYVVFQENWQWYVEYDGKVVPFDVDGLVDLERI